MRLVVVLLFVVVVVCVVTVSRTHADGSLYIKVEGLPIFQSVGWDYKRHDVAALEIDDIILMEKFDNGVIRFQFGYSRYELFGLRLYDTEKWPKELCVYGVDKNGIREMLIQIQRGTRRIDLGESDRLGVSSPPRLPPPSNPSP